MELVVEGAAAPVRLRNYHRSCSAQDAPLNTMNEITARRESAPLRFHRAAENKADLNRRRP